MLTRSRSIGCNRCVRCHLWTFRLRNLRRSCNCLTADRFTLWFIFSVADGAKEILHCHLQSMSRPGGPEFLILSLDTAVTIEYGNLALHYLHSPSWCELYRSCTPLALWPRRWWDPHAKRSVRPGTTAVRMRSTMLNGPVLSVQPNDC